MELKNLSVYSLKSPTKTSSTSVNRLPDPSISAASRKIPVSPIKEQEEPEDPKTDKPIRRTVSFTNSVSVFKSSEFGNKAEAETQPLVIRRTKSSGRLSQEIARRSGSDIYGVSPSDFEVALGRAGLGGLDTPPGGFSVGSDPESSPTSDSEGKFMSQMSTSSSRKEELGPLFQPVDPDEEEIFLEAATKDLCHILGLQVSFGMKHSLNSICSGVQVSTLACQLFNWRN